MNVSEYNQLLQKIANDIGGDGRLNPKTVKNHLHKRLNPAEYWDVINIMFNSYFQTIHLTPEARTIASEIVAGQKEIEKNLSVGTPRYSSKESILERNSHLAAHFKAQEKKAEQTFERFGKIYSYATLSVTDLYEIGDIYKKYAAEYQGWAETYYQVAEELESRGVDKLDELQDHSPAAYRKAMERLATTPRT